jgi:hypothetical protein
MTAMKQLHIRITYDQNATIEQSLGTFEEVHGVAITKQALIGLVIEYGLETFVRKLAASKKAGAPALRKNEE